MVCGGGVGVERVLHRRERVPHLVRRRPRQLRPPTPPGPRPWAGAGAGEGNQDGVDVHVCRLVLGQQLLGVGRHLPVAPRPAPRASLGTARANPASLPARLLRLPPPPGRGGTLSTGRTAGLRRASRVAADPSSTRSAPTIGFSAASSGGARSATLAPAPASALAPAPRASASENSTSTEKSASKLRGPAAARQAPQMLRAARARGTPTAGPPARSPTSRGQAASGTPPRAPRRAPRRATGWRGARRSPA